MIRESFQQPLVFDALNTETDTSKQWNTLDFMHPLEGSVIPRPEDSQRALDFAANPHSSPSLLVRAYAQEVGLRGLIWAEDNGFALSTSQQKLLARLRQRIPAYFDGRFYNALALPRNPNERLTYTEDSAYRFGLNSFFIRLARNEGLPEDLLFSDEDSYWPDTQRDKMPISAGLLMQSFISDNRPRSITWMTPTMATEALELVLDIEAPDFEDRAKQFSKFAPLARLAFSAEHNAPIDFLRNLPDDEAAPYASELNDLYDAAANLQRIYPMIDGEQAVFGARRLLARSLFGLRYFFENGKYIDTTVTLPGGAPRRIQEDDPLYLMRSYREALDLFHNDVAGPNARAVSVVDHGDFHHILMADITSDRPPMVGYHGRPVWGEAFDPQYEFAGDPTSRYRGQLDNPTEAISFDNAQQTLGTVGIRTDYSKVHGREMDHGAWADNPYTKHGDAALELRIGRFFGLGDWLLSQETGGRPRANHVPVPADAEEATRAIIRHREWLESKMASPDELRAYWARVGAAAALLAEAAS